MVRPEIQIPEGVTQVNISQDGIIAVQVAGQVQAEGPFNLLADFSNRQGLEPIGELSCRKPFQWPASCSEPF